MGGPGDPIPVESTPLVLLPRPARVCSGGSSTYPALCRGRSRRGRLRDGKPTGSTHPTCSQDPHRSPPVPHVSVPPVGR